MRKEIIGNATLYLGDCLEILPTLEKVDAVITDPPYGIDYSHGVGGGKLARSTQFDHHPIAGDKKPFDPSPWLGFERVVLFGANHFASRLPDSSFWLVWDKRDGICTNDQADCELAWVKGKSHNKGQPNGEPLKGNARLMRHIWNGMLKDSERGVQRVHPTQKPVAVMVWAIDQVGRPETILDPYMGSGTTGVACMNLGRKFIGIELDPTYFDIACTRIENAQRQVRMFA